MHSVILIILIIFFSGNLFAFDPASDCKEIINVQSSFWSSPDFQTIFDNYKNTEHYSKKLADGTYTLCFNPNKQVSYNKDRPIEISATINAPLLIYGLNIDGSKLKASALLKLTGSNITIRDGFLVGPWNKMWALPDVVGIEVSDGSGNIVIGPNFNFNDFNTGILVKPNAGVLATQVQWDGPLIPVLPSSAIDGKLISKEWIGKDVTGGNSSVINNIVGKILINEEKGDKCAGSVELFTDWYKWKKMLTSIDHYYYETCQVSKVEGKDIVIENPNYYKGIDGVNIKTIPIGSCYFNCKILNAPKKYFSVEAFSFNGCLGNTSDGGTVLADCDPANWYIPQTLQFLPAYLYFKPTEQYDVVKSE